MRDKLFSTPPSKQFEFDEGVASVFDDMAIRSIPYYSDVLKLNVDFSLNALIPNTNIYDLGCSTGNFLLELSNHIQDKTIHIKGIDNSAAMIERATLKAKAYGKKIDFICQDFLEFQMENASVIIANYTIQFIRPIQRNFLIKKIFEALCNNGIFIMSEKTTSPDKILDKQMIDLYHNYKKEQGYTQNEITTKREALENVLVPYSLEENFEMLRNAGFKSIEVIFKWVNFTTIIARKS